MIEIYELLLHDTEQQMIPTLTDTIFSGEIITDSPQIQMLKYPLPEPKWMRVDTDQTQKMDIIQVILLSYEVVTGVAHVMIIYGDEAGIVGMVMDDDIL